MTALGALCDKPGIFDGARRVVSMAAIVQGALEMVGNTEEWGTMGARCDEGYLTRLGQCPVVNT